MDKPTCAHRGPGTYCVGKVKATYYYGVKYYFCELCALAHWNEFQTKPHARRRALENRKYRVTRW